MYTTFSVTKYNNTGDGTWSVTPSVMTDFYDVQVTQSLKDNKDTFSFKIDNYFQNREWEYKPGDLINIHLNINGLASSNSNLVMVGLVKKVSAELSKNRVLRIEGVSYSDIVTNALVFYDPGDRTENVTEYLQGCLSSVSLRNKGFELTWKSTNPVISKVFTTAANKVKDYDKSFSSLLDKYLKDAYTGDGDYYWFVNNLKELVIGKRVTGSIISTLTEGVDFKTIKTSVNTDDVKNFIIVKCGYDLNNNPVSTRYDDVVSRAKNGFRYHMIVDRNITKDILSREPTISNADLIIKAKDAGYKLGESYATKHNKGYLTVNAELSPTVTYTVGDRVNIVIPSYADYNKLSSDTVHTLNDYTVRVDSIQYNIDGVLLTLIEEAAA